MGKLTWNRWDWALWEIHHPWALIATIVAFAAIAVAFKIRNH